VRFTRRARGSNKLLNYRLARLPTPFVSCRWIARSAVKAIVGIEQVMDGIWAVYFSWKRIGFLDERKMCIIDNLGRLKRRIL